MVNQILHAILIFIIVVASIAAMGFSSLGILGLLFWLNDQSLKGK